MVRCKEELILGVFESLVAKSIFTLYINDAPS